MIVKCDQTIQKYLSFAYTQDEELNLYRHFAQCSYCKTELGKNGYDKEDLTLMLSLSSNMEKKEGFEERLKKAEGCFHNKLAGIEIEKFDKAHPKINFKNERRSKVNLYSYIFKPSFAVAVLILLTSYPIYKIFSNKQTTHDVFRAKGNPPSIVKVELLIRKIDDTVIYDNDTVKTGDTVIFQYKNITRSYVSVFHLSEGKVTVIQDEKLTTKGETVKNAGWLFEVTGEHYFITAAALQPGKTDEIIKVLKMKGTDMTGNEKFILYNTDDIAISIRKVIVDE